MMLTELRLKSQVTIPKAIINKLGLCQGDTLEIEEKNGIIKITPVAVYPKKAIEAFERIAEQAEADHKAGKLKEYTSVEELIRDLKAGK